MPPAKAIRICIGGSVHRRDMVIPTPIFSKIPLILASVRSMNVVCNKKKCARHTVRHGSNAHGAAAVGKENQAGTD